MLPLRITREQFTIAVKRTYYIALISGILLGTAVTAIITRYFYGRWPASITAEAAPAHVHAFGQWAAPAKDGERYMQTRSCTNCGWAEIRYFK